MRYSPGTQSPLSSTDQNKSIVRKIERRFYRFGNRALTRFSVGVISSRLLPTLRNWDETSGLLVCYVRCAVQPTTREQAENWRKQIAECLKYGTSTRCNIDIGKMPLLAMKLLKDFDAAREISTLVSPRCFPSSSPIPRSRRAGLHCKRDDRSPSLFSGRRNSSCTFDVIHRRFPSTYWAVGPYLRAAVQRATAVQLPRRGRNARSAAAAVTRGKRSVQSAEE